MELFWVPYPGPGRLAVCTPPRGGHWLADDIGRLVGAGVEMLVSAVMPLEQRELQLDDEAAVAEAAGLEFVAMPTGNLGVPGLEGIEAIERLDGRLASGACVAVHCRASVGRGPTIAAALMVLAGADLGAAWRAIEAVRGRAVPDTNEQRAWPARFAALQIPRKEMR